MTEDVQKLTLAQAKWIEQRALTFLQVGTHGPVAAFQEVLDELTAKPGDPEWCDGCKLASLGIKYMLHKCPKCGDEFQVAFQTLCSGPPCSHRDFKPAFCPIDRWGEKGGDADGNRRP